MARTRRRKKHRAAPSNPPKRRRRHRARAIVHHTARHRVAHRRRARRNPPAMRGVVGMAIQGVKDAAWITVGQVANRSLLKLMPALPATWSPQMQSVAGSAIQGAGAVAVGWASAMVVGREAARFVLAGALASALQNAIKAAVPAAAPLLGDYPGWMMGYARVAGYARTPMQGYARMHGYEGPRAMVGTSPRAAVGMGDLIPEGEQWALAGGQG